MLVFGAINLDLLFAVDTLPGADETKVLPSAHIWPGGKGANQAVAAARDGARVMFAGAVGDDGLADQALAGLTDAGIDTQRVVRVPGASTGVGSISRDARQQTRIVTASNANLFARAAQIEDRLLGPGTVLLVQMDMDRSQIASLILRARERGARVILNFAPAGMLDTDALRAVDLLLLDEGDSGWLSVHLGAGVGAGSLRAALGVDVVRTLGVSGLEYADASGMHRMGAHPVDEVDRTGAQDCLAGVLAAGLERGSPLRHALERANIAAGLSCRHLGIQPSLPMRAEIDAAFDRDLHQDVASIGAG